MTARAPACRECPGSHEQYLLLLKSTVARLVLRLPDRNDTLGHVIRACLPKIGQLLWATFSAMKMTFPPLRNGRERVTHMGERNGRVISKQALPRYGYHPSNEGWLISGWLVGPQRG